MTYVHHGSFAAGKQRLSTALVGLLNHHMLLVTNRSVHDVNHHTCHATETTDAYSLLLSACAAKCT
jgi:hypothetical protein